jgi:hypothetical protein
MYGNFVGLTFACAGWMFLGAAPPAGPEKPIKLSPLQQQVADAHQRWVIPAEKLPKAKRHFIRLKTLAFGAEGDLRAQIEAYENENRRGYETGPFYVHDRTGKEGDETAWEAWSREAFTIEPERARGLEVPYFCQVLRLRDRDGKSTDFDQLSPSVCLKLSHKAVRAILEPLSSKPKGELAKVPFFVVSYSGNFEGNAKFVKLYVGKPETREFLVLDVSVYDHY